MSSPAPGRRVDGRPGPGARGLRRRGRGRLRAGGRRHAGEAKAAAARRAGRERLARLEAALEELPVAAVEQHLRAVEVAGQRDVPAPCRVELHVLDAIDPEVRSWQRRNATSIACCSANGPPRRARPATGSGLGRVGPPLVDDATRRSRRRRVATTRGLIDPNLCYLGRRAPSLRPGQPRPGPQGGNLRRGRPADHRGGDRPGEGAARRAQRPARGHGPGRAALATPGASCGPWRWWTPATASASTCSPCPTARGWSRCASRSTTPTTSSASRRRRAAALGCAFCATGELGLTRSLQQLGDGRAGPPRAGRLHPPRHRRGVHGAGRAVPQLRRGDRGRLRALRPGRRRASTRGASPSPPPASCP